MSRAEWLQVQRELMDELEVEETITIQFNNGTGFTAHTGEARVVQHTEQDLVAGGPIQQGDMKLIIAADRYPALPRDLDRRDRVEVRGASCGVIHFNPNTRSILGAPIAYEVTVRG